MKRAILISILMVMVMAPQVMADQVNLYQLNGYYTGSGGEFTVNIINRSASPDLEWVLPLYDSKTKGIGGYTYSFQTFCVETKEYISLGTTYDFSITDKALLGGTSTGDPISKGTAWLYHEFQLGKLTGTGYDYNYTPGSGRVADAGKLQVTFWALEEEPGYNSDPGTGNEFRNAVVAKFGSWDNAKANNNGEFPVAVLNLWATGHVNDFETDPTTGKYKWLKQDQLVCVPEPATMIFLSSGLLGMAVFLRKKFKK